MEKEKQKKHRLRKILVRMILLGGCLGIIGVLTLLGMNAYMKGSVRSKILSEEEAIKLEQVDCILVLGAGVWANNTPSPMLKDRLDQGIALYQQGVSDKIIMSGDHGRTQYDEVNVMKQYAIERGIPSEHIFMDHAGFSTYESMYRARDIFQVKKMIVITQKYHMYRALYDGQGLGLAVYGVSSDPRRYAGASYREMREVLARCKDFLYILFKPKPTYLGETIPVSGNGNLTNDK